MRIVSLLLIILAPAAAYAGFLIHEGRIKTVENCTDDLMRDDGLIGVLTLGDKVSDCFFHVDGLIFGLWFLALYLATIGLMTLRRRR